MINELRSIFITSLVMGLVFISVMTVVRYSFLVPLFRESGKVVKEIDILSEYCSSNNEDVELVSFEVEEKTER